MRIYGLSSGECGCTEPWMYWELYWTGFCDAAQTDVMTPEESNRAGLIDSYMTLHRLCPAAPDWAVVTGAAWYFSDGVVSQTSQITSLTYCTENSWTDRCWSCLTSLMPHISCCWRLTEVRHFLHSLLWMLTTCVSWVWGQFSPRWGHSDKAMPSYRKTQMLEPSSPVNVWVLQLCQSSVFLLFWANQDQTIYELPFIPNWGQSRGYPVRSDDVLFGIIRCSVLIFSCRPVQPFTQTNPICWGVQSISIPLFPAPTR